MQQQTLEGFYCFIITNKKVGAHMSETYGLKLAHMYKTVM